MIAFVYKLLILIKSVSHKECVWCHLISRVELVLVHMMQVNKLSYIGRKKKRNFYFVYKSYTTQQQMHQDLFDYSISPPVKGVTRCGENHMLYVIIYYFIL